MFNFVHKHKQIIQAILALMIIPFMFSGVSNLSSVDFNSGLAAKVGQQEITVQQFDQKFQQYLNKMRTQLGEKYNEAEFNTPEQRVAVLNDLVDQYTIEEAVRTEHLTVSDAQLLSALLKDPIISRDAQGNVDVAKYEAVLKQNNLTKAQYEDRVRSGLSAELVETMANSGYGLLPAEQTAVTNVLTQVRLVEIKPIDLAPYMAKVSVGPDNIDAYYKANTAKFTKTESFDIDYAVVPVLPANYVPTDADIKAAFGGSPSAAEIDQVKKDPALLKDVLGKTATAKMESVAKAMDAASSKAPQDLAALVTQFGGQVESLKNVTREGDDKLPDALKSADARMALITGPQVAGKAISSPVRASATSLIVGRVTKSTPAGLLPLADVQAEIENTLKLDAVLSQAREDAKKQIASMSATAEIGPKVAVGPLLNSQLSRNTIGQILAVGKDVPKLMVSDDPSNVSIVRVIGEDPNKPALDKFTGLQPSLQQWAGIAGLMQQRAYLDVLRQRLGVKLFTDRLISAEKPKA